MGEWQKRKIVLHEKRKRRRHFNFITILCAVYFLDKNAMECLRVGDDILSRACAEDGLFVVLHLNRAPLTVLRSMNLLAVPTNRWQRKKCHTTINKIPDP